ncbi:hypothetical protein EXIGLDRAFT_427461 [Exidia glandulosa HHB12029]|uniref:F-box domain-containing protein n=1 Tax=Exidia glandulosa HHB12029 TaxID=1314781 RepID=A0A165KIA5_EXIGL|nr:hypothetical protein EXIGLDRAFT_427461 [Exidia glandulosa HHB12029]
MAVSSQIHTAWKDRIAADQAIVDDATTQRLATRHECQLAEDALALAAAKVDFLKAELYLLDERHSAAVDQLARSRAASLRIVVSNLADDVLRCIFTCCAQLPDTRWEEPGTGSFNRVRAILPFSLAAVCTRWRRVALDYGGLWTYISLPTDFDFALAGAERLRHCHYSRIKTLLSRSRMFPLDVLLVLSPYYHQGAGDESRWISSIFSAVFGHTDRWRRFEITFPNDCARDIVSVFTGPLPKLKQLSLVGPQSHAWESLEHETTHFFPHAPLLESLHLALTGMTVSPVHEGFPSLLRLAIDDDMSAESLQRLLELSKTSLQVLELQVAFAERCSSSLSLPNLGTLVLHLELFLVTAQGTVNFNAPRLSALTLRSAEVMFDGDLPVLLEHVSETVTSLTLYGAVRPRYIDIFARLRNLSQIVFGTQHIGCDVDDESLVVLSKQLPTVWPRLQTIVFCNADITPSHGNGVIQLVAARNASHNNATLSSATETDESARPCRIREVQLPVKAPKWTVAEVQRLLSINS